MPPYARNPSTSALSIAELGLASFWKMTVFLAGIGWAGLLALLWLIGRWAYLLLLALTLPLPPECLRQELH